MYKNINEKIKKIRNKAKLSQARFGYKLGLSGKTISAYETGKIYPPLKVLEAISEEYGENLLAPTANHKTKLISKLETIESSLTEIKDLLGICD